MQNKTENAVTQNVSTSEIMSLVDLTDLNLDHSENEILDLINRAKQNHVAAVCLYPKFIKLAKSKLADTAIKVATVVNFPGGDQTLNEVQQAIHTAVSKQVDEIDLVMPYQTLIAGEHTSVRQFIKACKITCGPTVKLKVILETGALLSDEFIQQAAEIAITSGADFIKTSTGKIATGATLHAAEIMLKMINHYSSGFKVGFKASGGIRQINQAEQYYQLAKKIMGESWITAKTFRIGASQLS